MDPNLAWLAGLLEGEGTFFVTKCRVKGKVYRYPRISVGMTDRDVIQRVCDMFGTKLFEPKRAYGVSVLLSYRATVTGKPAAEWMRSILPMMGQRRSAKIREVLAEWDARPSEAEMRRASCQAVASRRQRAEDGTFLAHSTTG